MGVRYRRRSLGPRPAGRRSPAHYAVLAMPREGNDVNTLGIAHYRAGHWKQAIATLARSMELQKGAFEAFDSFFLAMAYWQLGEKDKARQWYDRAVKWTETHGYQLRVSRNGRKSSGASCGSRQVAWDCGSAEGRQSRPTGRKIRGG